MNIKTSDGRSFTFSYRQLTSHILSLAKIISPSIKQGDRVVLYKLNNSDWIISYFAVVSVGGIAVTVDSRANNAYVQDVIELTKPKFIFTTVAAEDIPNTSNVKIAEISKLDLEKQVDFVLPDLNEDNPCEIIFTSGTWAKPKGVTLSQKNIFTNLNENSQRFSVTPKDRFLSIIPVTHIYEQMAGLLVPLYFGASIFYHPLESKKDFNNALKFARPTKLVVVPLVAELIYNSYGKTLGWAFAPIQSGLLLSRRVPTLIRRALWYPLRLSLGGSLNQMVIGGAPMTIELDHFFQGLGVEVFIGYGLSETSPVISISKNQKRKPGEVGKPYDSYEYSQNHTGELLVRGPSVFKGYWPDISNSDETWYNTGDIVIFDQQGRLIIKGRSKNMFVYPSGDKIFAEDIEALMNEYLDCETCCVNIGVGLDNDLKVVTTRPDINLKECKAYLASKLPGFVQINDILYYGESELPRTFSKKINRRVVQDWVEILYARN